ncbi:metallophosphoesterase [Nibricoccus aquaticus]|uniref:Metallophosphoesterase n=1 Tax=Nibricoccus aquaticus TaxID=2576891 RepID=A0A290QB98_9BACT|nr:metallophosphoesterase family protein [Nibricoccus aquaticus]ATC65949.1 metallophosphoesterase [Nibricoccus aquaticus]
MRIAILADIHGNLAALEAALERMALLEVDQLVVAGDIVVGAPDSLACWERVKALGCPVLRGNHERYVFDLGTERAKPEWSSRQFGPVQWAAAQLGEANRRELAALPGTLKIAGADDVLFVHGSARNDTDLIFPYTSDAEIAPMFTGFAEKWIVRGHNHYAGVRLWGERRIVTTGSVGLALDGTVKAQFAVVERRGGSGSEWRLEHHAVAYDVAATLRRARESEYVEKAGPIARLFMREVETAAFHILPFQQFNAALVKAGKTLPLEQAVEAFMRRE